MENTMKIPKKIKIELPYDPAIPLLGIYPKKTKTLIWKDISTPVFIAALFTKAKIWKQPKCLRIDEWIKKMWDIYIGIDIYEYYSAIKKEWDFVICRNMDGPRAYYAEWNKSDSRR